MISSVSSDYKKCVKPIYLEEVADFFIFRPIAYLVVKGTYSLPLNPNHYSLMALLCSIFAGFYLSKGSESGFVLGGIFIFSFSILDCCDGMIARMKKNGSKYGDLIDMFVDLVSSIIFFVGLYIGLSKNMDYSASKFLVIPAALLILFHATIYNYYKKQYSFYLQGEPSGRSSEIENYKEELKELQNTNGSFLEISLVKLFLFFSSAQKSCSEDIVTYPREEYLSANKSSLFSWGLIAGSSHLFFLSLGLIFNLMNTYFFIVLILFNLIAMIVFWHQNKIYSKIEKPRC